MSGARNNLTDGAIGPTLLRMTAPMLVATASIVVFNLTDTYFIGLLGGAELAAISYTFPVVMLLGGIIMGLGMGAGSAVARRVGANDHRRTVSLSVSVLILGFALAALVLPLGLFTFEYVFSAMGADNGTLPLIYEYMSVWYAGTLFFIAPMLGNAVIRATGDTKSSMITMVLAAAANIVLDPILIFGAGPIPALGIAGAAWATIIARAATLAVTIHLLRQRIGFDGLKDCRFGEIVSSWKEILAVGGPAVGVNALLPIGLGAITAMVSLSGQEAVAGFGVGSRVEAFAFMPVMSLSAALMPLVGQNRGAQRYERIEKAVFFAQNTALIWGCAVYLAALAAAPGLASVFAGEEVIRRSAVWYMRFGMLSLPLIGVFHLSVISFNALGRPGPAAVLNLSRIFVLALPLAYAGHLLFGLAGVYFGMAAGTVIGGMAARRWIFSAIDKMATSAVPAVASGATRS